MKKIYKKGEKIIMPKALDIGGKRFGHLIAIEKVPSRSGKTYWRCKCDCGREKEIQTAHLTSKATISCGDSNCPYHYNPLKTLKNETNRICEICGKEFITDNIGRKYCFECSPPYSNDDPDSLTYSKMTLRKAMRIEIIRRHGGKCIRCGYNKCIDAFNFHHRDPNEKIFNVSMSGTMRSWQEYLQEAEKCDLLCANCHAEEHYKLNQQKKE